MTYAIRPSANRISAIMPSAPGEDGYTFQLATARDYRRYARANPFKGNALASERERPLIRNHGVAVLMEIFDTVDVNVPFTGVALVGELHTIRNYTIKTQYCIISAVLRWAAAQDEPQVRKTDGKWVL